MPNDIEKRKEIVTMKLCESYLEEPFDSDVICPKCNSDKLICDDELHRIKKELRN